MIYDKLATKAEIKKTTTALTKKGFTVVVVGSAKEALVQIKKTIPKGASVMNGSSVTLEQIGYLKYLEEDKHGWLDWHAKINSEDDKVKRAGLRHESVLSDFYVGSVHALAQTGEFLVASNTGSQLPHVVYTSPNLIFVVSTKKIVKNLAAAFDRLESYVVPLEDKHMQKLYKMNTALNKIVVFKGEAPMIGRKINFILVEEDLGF
jgi:L-lactate utilization protein LutC